MPRDVNTSNSVADKTCNDDKDIGDPKDVLKLLTVSGEDKWKTTFGACLDGKAHWLLSLKKSTSPMRTTGCGELAGASDDCEPKNLFVDLKAIPGADKLG